MAGDAAAIDLAGETSGLARFVPGVGSIIDGARHSAGIDVSWARVRHPVLDMLERSGLMDRVGEDHVFLEVDDAVSELLDS